MGACQMRFLAEDDAKMKTDHRAKGVDEQIPGAKGPRPTEQDQDNGCIHRVAAVAIQSSLEQPLGWRPGGEGALAET